MSAWGEQLIAALVAAIVPLVVKLLNDWHDRQVEPEVAGRHGRLQNPPVEAPPYDQDNERPL